MSGKFLSDGFKELLRQSKQEAAAQVDEEEVSRFIQDSYVYSQNAASTYNKATWSDLTGDQGQAVKNERFRTSNDMAMRANRVRAWAQVNQDRLDPSYYKELTGYLDNITGGIDDTEKLYSRKTALMKNFSSQEEYDKAVNNANFLSKYSGMTKNQMQTAIAGLEEGAERSWLQEYEKSALRNAEDYDYELARTKWELERMEQALPEFWQLSKAYRDLESQPDQGYGLGYDKDLYALKGYRNSYSDPVALEGKIAQAKERIYELEAGKKYSLLDQEADFAQLSQYDGEGSFLQDRVADPETSDAWDTAYTVLKNTPAPILGTLARLQEKFSYQNLHLMTDEERKRFYYLYNKNGEDSAKEYMDYLQRHLNARSAQKLSNWVADRTQDIPGLSQAVASLVSTPIKFASGEGLVDVVDQHIRKSITGDKHPVDYNRDGMMFANAGNAIRSSVAGQIYDKTGSEFAAGAYQAGMGLVDSAAVYAASAINPALGAAASALLSASSATDTMLTAAQNGASDDQALTLGLAAGFFEYFFEKFELDSLLDGGTNAITKAMKQSFSEVLGEELTEVCNLAVNTYVMAEQSDIEQAVRQYLKDHPDWTEDQARAAATKDVCFQLLNTAGVAITSGSIMGGVAAAVNTVSENRSMKNIYYPKDGSNVNTPLNAPTLVQEVLAVDPENKLALSAQKKLAQGKKLSGNELRRLTNALGANGNADTRYSGTDKSVPYGDDPGTLISDVMDETIAQLTGAPADPVGAALDGFRETGTVSNKQASYILNNASAVQRLVRETGMKLPDNASGKRAAVKEAIAKLAQQQATENNYLSDGDEDVSGIRTQLRSSQNDLNAMEPVADIRSPEEFKQMDLAQKKNWVVEKLRSTGYSVERKGFGVIQFAKKRLKAAFKYFDKGSVEEAAFEAIPYVLEKGIEISARDNHKTRGYATVTFAAPVTINGKRGNMAVVVKQIDGNAYKVHRILAPDGSVFELEDTKTGQDPPIRRESPETGSLATAKDPASQDAAVNKDEPGHRQEQPLVTAPNVSVSQDGTGVNQETVGAAPEGFDTYSHLQFEYGNKPDRKGTVRDINVPKKDGQGQRVSDFAANLYGNAITDEEMVGTLEQLIAQGAFGAQRMKLDDVVNSSIDRVGKRSVDAELERIANEIADERYNPELLADAMVMFTKAQQEGNFVAAGEFAYMAAEVARIGGRILNVCKLTRRLTPEGQFAARQKMVERINKARSDKSKEKHGSVEISQATKEAFMNVANAGETVITDAAQTLNEALPTDAMAAAQAAMDAVLPQDDTSTRAEGKTDAKKESLTPAEIGEKAGKRAAKSVEHQEITPQNAQQVFYGAIMEYINSKRTRTPKQARTRSLDALQFYYAQRTEFQEAWSSARRAAEQALQGNPEGMGILQEFLDSEEAQEISDAYARNSVSRKALREGAKLADVDLSRAMCSSLADKTATLERIQQVVAQRYALDEKAAMELAQQLQAAYLQELSQRQSQRLRQMFGEKNVKESTDLRDQFQKMYDLGAFDHGGQIKREALKKLFGADGLTLSQELLDEYGRVSDARKDVIDRRIIQEIADQLPTDMGRILNKWRYTAMLFNPSTHLKNGAGNLGQFIMQAGFRDGIAAGIEAAVSKISGGKIQRTKAFLNMASKSDRALVATGYHDYGTLMNNEGEIARRIQNGGKYDQMVSSVEESRRTFKVNDPKNGVTKGIDKVLSGVEAVADLNTAALNLEDAFFGRNTYALALAAYMKANGLTVPTEEARTYAVAQAQTATFHDDSWLYNKLKGKVGKGTKIVVPFVKTPANVTMRAVEYSPGMLIKTAFDLIRLARQPNAEVTVDEKRRVTAAQVIEEAATGLVGSALWGVGAWLAKEGLIRIVGTGSDEKREYERLMGQKDYYIQIGDISLDCSFASPAILPVYTGAALYEAHVNLGENGVTYQSVIDSIYSFADPILSSSMLSGLDSFLYAMRSVKGNSSGEVVGAAVKTAFENYLNQFYPALLRRIAQASDNTGRVTYVETDNPLGSILQSYQSSTPGLREDMHAKYDIWGQEIKNDDSGGDGFWGTAWRTINPARAADVHSTEIDEEILRLSNAGYDAIPTASNRKYFQVNGKRVDLTAQQHETYEREEGRKSFAMAKAIINSKAYAGLTDEEKAAALKAAYDYANEIGKAAAVPEYEAKIPKYLVSAGDDPKALAALMIDKVHADNVGVSLETYQDMTGAGVSDSVADYVSDLLRDIQPEEGKTSVRNIQKMEAIVEDDRISDADVEKLLPLYLSEGGQENYETALDRGYDSEDFVAAYRIYLDKEKGEKKNAVIREIAADTGISYSAAKRLYEIVTEPHPKD